MTKIKVNCPNGIEFETDVKNPKEWATALRDLHFVSLQNRKNAVVMPEGKRLVMITYDLYQRIEQIRKNKENWEEALLREMSRAKASEMGRHSLAELREIKDLLKETNGCFDFLKARLEKRAFGGKADI